MNSKRKILFLASWYPSKENPTLGNFVQKHAELANQVANVDVLYAVQSSSVQEITVVDEHIIDLRTVIVYYPVVQSKVPVFSSFVKKEAYSLALKKGFQHLNTKYDLVHLNAIFPAGIFAKWLKKKHEIPYVATVHWTGFLKQHNEYQALPFYLKKSFQNIFKEASQIFPVSIHLGESLKELKLIKEYSVLNNVVQSKYFYPTIHKGESSAITRFLHISTFDEKHKNISGMLSAFSNLNKDFVLHLITEGSEKEVWSSIEKAGIPKAKCKVESKLGAQEIGEAMRCADCFVLFSNYETFSVVMAEAWMSGLPIIYSQCGGLTEISNPKLGIQIEKENEKGLLSALEEFSTNDYSSELICEFSKQFKEDSIRNQLKEIYNSLV